METIETPNIDSLHAAADQHAAIMGFGAGFPASRTVGVSCMTYLGVDANALETERKAMLERGRRWGG